MRKAIVAISSLVIAAGSVVMAGASDYPAIESAASSVPTLSLGGSEFFPIINTLTTDGSTDLNKVTLMNESGLTFPIESKNGMNVIGGNLSYQTLYSMNWPDSKKVLKIPFMMQGPMNVGHVLFPTGKFALDSNDRKVLNAMASEVAKTGLKGVYVVGRADIVGTNASNLVLSRNRAITVMSYLAKRLKAIGVINPKIHYEYMGALTARGTNIKGTAADRRVDVMLYPIA